MKQQTTNNKKTGILLLLDYLKYFYHLEDEIIIYEAAQYPGFEPKIVRTQLQYLPDIQLSTLSTLYVPPVKKAPCNDTILSILGLK